MKSNECCARDDGLLWIVIGDSYNAYNGNRGKSLSTFDQNRDAKDPKLPKGHGLTVKNIKNKDLLGVPWMLAFALRADGWYLRSDIIWAKPNPMPGSQRDRCTSSHEHVFMLSKQDRYFYDDIAIQELAVGKNLHDLTGTARIKVPGQADSKGNRVQGPGNGTRRTKRDVWTIPTKPFPAAHFAVFPEALIEPMILASTAAQACSECGAPWRRVVDRQKMEWREWPTRDAGLDSAAKGSSGTRTMLRGTMTKAPLVSTLGFKPNCEHEDGDWRCSVLDPFAGAGTTGKVAIALGRDFVGFEIAPQYVEMARERIASSAPINSAPDPHRALLEG